MKKVLALLALCAVSSFGAAIPVGGGWVDFYFGAAPSTNLFDYTSAFPVTIKVTDMLVIGDEFTVNVNNTGAVPTSDASANDGVQSGAHDPDTAWADGRLSKILLFGPSGTNIPIDVTLVKNTMNSRMGQGFIRVDAVDGRVPEPSTYALVGSALGMLAVLRRRRRA